jgi:DNA-binding protein YbaB
MPIDLTRQLEFAERLLDRSKALSRHLAELTGAGAALDGQVAATVDSAGRPLALTIEPRAMRNGSDELAAAILSAFGDAHDDLSRASTDLIESVRGDLPDQLRDPLGSGVVDDLAEHGRELARTLQASSDPAADALRLSQGLQDRVLRGI